MKKININQLDEKEEEIADALVSLGLGRLVAWTLAYLNNGEEATSVALEMGAGMRQPEVSIVMRQLKENDWINEKDEKRIGKGRPFKIYSLKVGFNDIITQLETEQKKANIAAQKKIEYILEKLNEKKLVNSFDNYRYNCRYRMRFAVAIRG
jgi:predicted transcriptional regulator